MKFPFLLILITTLLHLNLRGQKSLSISAVSTPPLIDGVISPGEWIASEPGSGFIQMEPAKGSPSAVQTEVYSLSDSLNIYFAFKCTQGAEHPLTANIQMRDKLLGSDDAVIIIMDTYGDSRSAYGFSVNPIGTQTDYKISDDGRNINYEWDIEWEAAASMTSEGWVCEVSIPFASLKYKSTANVWGANFGRILVSNSEISWWSGEMSDNYRISQGGSLEGIIPPSKPKRLMIFPYASLRYEDSDITMLHNKLIPDAGGDVLLNISSNLSLNATVNPDFASVEGDRVRIDLSGWEINFPEKRLFFQEGNEMFSLRYKPFYSRRIGDISYGAKFTGKAGRYAMNVLNVRSVEDLEEGKPAAFFTAARVKADVFKSSTLGAIFVDKSDFDTTFSRSFGVDWVMNPGERWKITGQLLGSYPGDFLKHSGGFLRIANETNKYHVHIRYTRLGEQMKDNINQTGFLSDDDRHEIDADLNYTFWLKESFLRYIRVSAGNNVYWGLDGDLRGYKFRDYIRFYLDNRFSYRLYYDNRYQIRSTENEMGNPVEIGFYNYFYENQIGYNTDASSHAAISYTFGRNFNRKMSILSAGFSVQPISKLNVRYDLTWLDFEPDTIAYSDIRLEQSTVLNILTLDYYFTNNLWIRLFAQHNTYDERIYLYGQFGWRFKPPFGALYLIYAGNNYFDHNQKRYYDHQTVFLKFTYPIGF